MHPLLLKSRDAARHAVRAVDAALPAPLATIVLWPFVLVAACARCIIRRPGLARWRAHMATTLNVTITDRAEFVEELRFAWAGVAWMCRDRLAQPRWSRRFRVDDPAGALAAQLRRGPVVVPSLHFGPSRLLSWVLASKGYPAGVAVHNADTISKRFKTVPGYTRPRNIAAGDPRALLSFLRTGGVLVIAVDFPRGRRVAVHEDGVHARVCTGAVRLAADTGAAILPGVIRAEGMRRYVVDILPPVPTPPRAERGGETPACAGVMRALLPVVRAAPEQCCRLRSDCFEA